MWQAITSPDETSKFWYNGSIQSTWEIGSSYAMWNPEGRKQTEGFILDMDPPNRLVMSWQLLALPDTAAERPSRLTWEIESHAEFHGVTLVTVVHDDFEQALHTAKVLEAGLPIVLSGMKTLLETGKSHLRESKKQSKADSIVSSAIRNTLH